jgi:HPr kinase/phosphorylase
MSKSAVLVHASCVRLARAAKAFGAPADAGVLLLGKSGAGKSDLALRLIALGAELVADDYTELFIRRGKLFGRAPKRIAGLIEARGIGIVKLPHAAAAAITLAAEPGRPHRLPAPHRYRAPAALALLDAARPPLVGIAFLETSAPAKILLAAAAYAHGLYRGAANTI